MIYVYLDQNVVSAVANSQLEFKKESSNVQWVYSDEHFNEILRSNSHDKYLQTLDSLRAKKLSQNLDILFDEGIAAKLFEEHKQAINEVSFETSVYSPLISRLMGGDAQGNPDEVIDNIQYQHNELNSLLPFESTSSFDAIFKDFSDTVYKIYEHDNNIELNRSVLGFEKGSANEYQNEKIILKLWNKLTAANENIKEILTLEQFFGFARFPFESITASPTLTESIVRCCSIFDSLGFQAEQKIRVPQKVSNVLSDAIHIANAARCHMLLSTDKRLVIRAKAIYEHLNFPTMPVLLKLSKKEEAV